MITNPLTWFFAGHAIIAGLDVALWSVGRMTGGTADSIQSILLGYLLALWVVRDSRHRLPGFPSDWGFLAGAVIVPAYIITSRGVRGLGLIAILAAGVTAIYVGGWLVSWILFSLSGDGSA